MLEVNEADVSAYSTADLIGAVAEFQLAADRVAHIAEDLPDGAVHDVCRQLYGNDARTMETLIADVIDVPCDDQGLFDRAIDGFGKFLH